MPSFSRLTSVDTAPPQPAPREADGPPTAARRGQSTRLERFLMTRLLKSLGPCPFRVRLWDGWSTGATATPSGQTVHIRNRLTLWRVLLRPRHHFLEAYARGSLEVEGDPTDLLRSLHRMVRTLAAPPREMASLLRRAARPGAARASRRHVSHHYDVGNDFYQLWLDERLLYTCAYFETDDASLETAQLAKMDHVCRKLQLRPGDEVIEAGCGWGALALHMARHYGARVRAWNLSREQLQYARERARAEGLAERVEFVEADWREIRGRCDAFVSVGMLEHVGIGNYPLLGQIIRDSLRPTGRGLIHTIGQNLPEPLNSWICERIFPGAQPPTLKQMMDIFQPHGMTVFDVENLRRHYAQTLQHWLTRYERSEAAIRKMFDDSFYRTWRMYLAASQAAFETGELELFQVLFAPTATARMPATRAHLYRHLPP